MDKDLKDLINTVEKETKTEAELQEIINSQKEEINRLKYTIKEQHLLIEEQGDQISFAQSDLPSEINILKEMITSQRRDIIKRDNDIESLNKKIDVLTTQMEKSKDGELEVQNNDLYEAQELILKLSQESEEYRNEIEDLNNQLKALEAEKNSLMETNKAQTEENEEMVNIKRLNFQLMEENGILRVELESLKSQLNAKNSETSSEDLKLAHEKINELSSEIQSLKNQIQEKEEDVISEELELAHKKMEDLVAEIEDYKAQLTFLQKELEKHKEPPIISTEQALEFAKLREEYDNLKSNLLESQKENKELKKKLIELESNQLEIVKKDTSPNSVAFDFPNHFQISLFKRMYKLLDDHNKKAVINTLIEDLNNKNNEIKRTAIRILSEIKDKKVYELFIDLIHDEDWLIRYNLIKALRKFDFDTEEFKVLLKNLSKDADVDVRELAIKILKEITK